MKKEIREVKNGILQVTTLTERWYARQTTDKAGLPVFEYVPSVTWIADYYPKGIGFYKWLANQGWDEAEALKQAAADKGSKVHQAILLLIDGGTIKIQDKFANSATGAEEWDKFSDEEIVDAIFKAEGGYKAQYLYGIRSIPYKTEKEARQICLNSVRNGRKRWVKANMPEDFVVFMGRAIRLPI